MSVIIDLHNKKILKVQNSIFALIHETIVELIEEKKIDTGQNIALFLKKTDQDIYGPGAVSADLENYFKTKQDMLLFASLVKVTIELKHENFNRFIGCVDHLWEFYNKLIEYADQLPDK